MRRVNGWRSVTIQRASDSFAKAVAASKRFCANSNSCPEFFLWTPNPGTESRKPRRATVPLFGQTQTSSTVRLSCLSGRSFARNILGVAQENPLQGNRRRRDVQRAPVGSSFLPTNCRLPFPERRRRDDRKRSRIGGLLLFVTVEVVAEELLSHLDVNLALVLLH